MKNLYSIPMLKNKIFKGFIQHNKLGAGFTLVELLVVIAILGVLVTIGLTAFTSAQARSRDTKRKADLKQIASALELFYNDVGSYPASLDGKILGCPSTGPTSCSWGTGQLTDGKTVYFRVLPKDPSSGYNYFYRSITVGALNQGFQLFAHLENTQDTEIISTTYSCGSGASTCNFAITSPNTTPAE
jgi:type II secretion system protein G